MSRSDKLYLRLAELEEAFLEKLLPELDRACVTGNPAIFAWVQPEHSLVNAFTYSGIPRPAIADLVEDIELLRKKLGESPEETLTAQYRRACLECINIADPHRRGPKRIAEELATTFRQRDRARPIS